ncbi:MAG: hypothetical protein Q9160_002602 [Pyrenula sp. 1 TL-2023]
MTRKPTTNQLVPRYLLPRLSWSIVPQRPSTGHVAKAQTSLLPKSATSHSPRRASFSTLQSFVHPNQAVRHSTSPRRPSPPPVPSPHSPKRDYVRSVSPTAPPPRYNGVYASTFKPARSVFRNSSSSSAIHRRQLSPSLPLLHRPFSTTLPRPKDHHFDTLKFVTRLKDEGFSEEQATAMMRVLNDVIEESIQNLTRTMVLKEDAERSSYTQKVDFAKLRSELMTSDSTEAQLTRGAHDRLTSDLAKMSNRFKDEIQRTQSSVKLDLNLEKGRINEEANGQNLRIKETEARIEQEVAGLRERVEAVKFSTLQWLM